MTRRKLVGRAYAKQGINYGIGQLSTAQIESDLDFLRVYFDRIRITYPAYNSWSVPYWQDICERAVAKNFEVMWGISCPAEESGNFDAFCQRYVELSDWAARHNIIYGVNEEAYHNNDSVISDTQVFTKLAAASRQVRARHPRLRLVVSVAGDGELAAFIAHGDRGGFDFVGLNQYDSLANYRSNLDQLANTYGERGIVTEFNGGRGFDPNYGTEATWTADIKARADYAQATTLRAFYAYTYAFNGELAAPGAYKWNFRTGTDPATHRQAFDVFI